MIKKSKIIFIICGFVYLSNIGNSEAQQVNFSPSDIDACLLTTAEARSCIGIASKTCYESVPGGGSSNLMNACFSEELDFWDNRLNIAYKSLLSRLDDQQTDILNNGASQTEALKEMQRAWIEFRDKTCSYEFISWGPGTTGGGQALSGCMMRNTGEQALRLEAYLKQTEH